MLSIGKAPALVVLAILLGTAVYTDVRYGKIFNKLTFPCMAAGLALGCLSGGWQGLLQNLAGMGVVLGLYLLAYSTAIGGGDAKLMMAVGSVVGLRLTVWSLLFSAVIGGIFAIIIMARYRTMLSTSKNLATHVYLKLALRAPVELSRGSAVTRFRYSPAIALGTILALLIK